MSLGNNFISSNDLCIDENLFFKVREYLKINGFKEKYPIYATGGYVSYILRNKEGFQVAIQKYITKEELEEKWISSIKRAFDLSISPNGELYEDWGQTTGKVKKIEL